MGKYANAMETKINDYFKESRNKLLQNYLRSKTIQINQYKFAQRKNTIYMLKLFFVASVISILIAYLYKIGIFELDTARSIIYGIYLLFIIAFILNWYNKY